MATDYSGWNGKKRRLQDLAAKKEVEQQEPKQPPSKKAKKKKPPTMKHRMDKAEQLVCDMAMELSNVVNVLTALHPEVVVPDNFRQNFWTKFHVHQAERLIKEAGEIVDAIVKEHT